MPNRFYRKGYRYEKKALEILESDFACYFTSRFPASRGIFDVIGISKDYVYLIEVKAYRRKVFRKAWIEKIKKNLPGKLPPNLRIGIWRWNHERKKFDYFWF